MVWLRHLKMPIAVGPISHGPAGLQAWPVMDVLAELVLWIIFVTSHRVVRVIRNGV